MIYAAFVAQPGELPTIRGDAISTMFYVANWHEIASGTNYFAIFNAPSPLQHTWSLAIEEQFYLVWPLVLVAILGRRLNRKVAAKRVLALSLGLAAVSVVLAQLLYKAVDPSRVDYGTDTRAASILLGAALAAALAAWGPIRGAACPPGTRRRSSRGRGIARARLDAPVGQLAFAVSRRIARLRDRGHGRDRERGAPDTRAGLARCCSNHFARSASSATACTSGTGRCSSG